MSFLLELEALKNHPLAMNEVHQAKLAFARRASPQRQRGEVEERVFESRAW
jgi:hypothetical protein